ncbi:hypothetical protein [Natrinema salaciae]|nr:hypothetical protein [Natrinema salaciae]
MRPLAERADVDETVIVTGAYPGTVDERVLDIALGRVFDRRNGRRREPTL